MRVPQVGIRSPVLSHDGANLAAAFETLRERGQTETLLTILQKAFPHTQFYVEELGGRFQMMMKKEGVLRPLESAEFSDWWLLYSAQDRHILWRSMSLKIVYTLIYYLHLQC